MHPTPALTARALACSSAMCLVVSYISARTWVSMKSDFGTGDIPAFLFWTCLLAMLLAPLALLFAGLPTRLPVAVGAPLAALLGAVAGLAWTSFVALLLGPWFGAFSFPVLYCWLIGGASGTLTVAWLGGHTGHR